MHIAIVSLFSGLFEAYSKESLFEKASEKGIVSLNLVDIRDFAKDRHRTADDVQFGGGAGMVMMPGPVVEAVESLGVGWEDSKRIIVSPRGRLFKQEVAEELSRFSNITIICGRYKGLDARVGEVLGAEELSVGDYVLGSGEVAALAIVDAVVRLLPGFLGDMDSADSDSHSIPGRLLSAPEYTRPRDFRGHRVPEILLSGNHAAIEGWRRRRSLELTFERNPSILENAELTREERAFIEALKMSRFEE